MYGALEKFHWAGEQNLASTSETHRTGSTQIDARTPHLLHTNDSKKTLVAEDFGLDVIDWKKHLLKVDSGQNTGVEVNGKHMGQWLRAYHQWTMMDSQQALRDAMRGYEEMGKFRRWIHYTGIPKWTEENGLLDEDTRIIFKQVEQLLVEEFADSQTRQVTDEWGPVHGDFWAGK